MTHILHVLTTPRSEGTPRLVLDWLSSDTRHQQSVVTLCPTPADLTEQLKTGAHDYHGLDVLRGGKRKFFDMAIGIRRIVRETSPDVVICWPTGFSNWICAGAWAGGCRKMLVHAGNPAHGGFKSDWVNRYVQWPLAMVGAKVICCSDYVRNSMASIPFCPKNLCHTIYNCTNSIRVAERAEAAKKSRIDSIPTVIMVATLERHKDHDTLLRAMPTVVKSIPNIRLRIVGDGSLKQELQNLCCRLGLENHVDFLGTRHDIPELLGTSDLFVFSTTPQEGLGSVLLEAMAARLPIISSDVPACRELLRGGEFGKLVSPRDPQELSEAIANHVCKKWPNSRGDADPTVTSAFQYSLQWTPERMIRDYLSTADA